MFLLSMYIIVGEYVLYFRNCYLGGSRYLLFCIFEYVVDKWLYENKIYNNIVKRN